MQVASSENRSQHSHSFHPITVVLHTSAFSPCFRKASSPFSFLLFFSRAKYSGLEILSRTLESRPLRSTFVEVAMTYRAFTLRMGTPLILNGPVTRRAPSFRCLRRTTRLPRKRPARRMRTAPGCRVARDLPSRMVLRACIDISVSQLVICVRRWGLRSDARHRGQSCWTTMSESSDLRWTHLSWLRDV